MELLSGLGPTPLEQEEVQDRGKICMSGTICPQEGRDSRQEDLALLEGRELQKSGRSCLVR
jgi:hypothetical protein